MLEIDGTTGGGQLLRTALSLSTITGTPFRIDEIRGSRPKPGLRPQHLTAVRLVADYCDATLDGAKLDSTSLTFRPGTDREQTLDASIGTAGSLTLLFDTILPIAALDDEPVEISAAGGTDVKWTPTADYYQHVKLPILARCGVVAELELAKTGFFPAGCGIATLRTTPSTLRPLELDSRGALERVEVYSKAAAVLKASNVATRQADHAAELLGEKDVPTEIRRVEYPQTRSAGSSLLLRGVYEETVIGVDALGERGKTSEAVAADAVDRFIAEDATGSPVDTHMADQVIVFLALAGGTVRIPRETAHVRTNLALVDRFGSDVMLDRRADDTLVLVADPHPVLR